jgi:hypothetical protein
MQQAEALLQAQLADGPKPGTLVEVNDFAHLGIEVNDQSSRGI